MQMFGPRFARRCSLAAALCLAGVSAGAQGRGNATEPLVQQVRTAIGHGDATAARRLAEGAAPDAAGRELAIAIVDIFEGKDDLAATRLEPLAGANPRGDAALELGLIDVRRGRRAQGFRRLEPIVSNRTFGGPDDYFRLARAARAVREFLLSADAYVQIASVNRADIHAERGDLFLQRHKHGDAASDYRKALEIDPQWVPALVGLSRALADQEPMESRAALEAARKIAPGHPDVLAMTVEHHLDTDDLPAARGALDELARARPGDIDEVSYRAALAYEDGGVAAVEAPAARAAEIDPLSALPYIRAGEQAARNYNFADGAALAERAVQRDDQDPRAHFDLGLYRMRTGDEAQARVALERSWELDNSSQLTKNLLDLLDKIDKFRVVEHGPFIFKFAPEEAAVLEAYAVPLAEEAYKTFTARYGFTPSAPLLIEVFPYHDDFAVRTLGLPGLIGALGACFGRVVAMDSPRARDPGVFSWQATLWHELAHVYTLQMSKYRVPRWLTEGVSVFEEHRKQPAWGRELMLEFAQLLARERTFGVKGLPDAFKRPESLALAYFEASLVVEHLVELNGDQGLRTLILAYADGASDAEAFTKAFGTSVDAVEASFKKFVDARFGALRAAMAPPGDGDPPRELAALQARAAAHPGSFIAQVALGQALLKAGDRAAAKAPLERAAKLAPPATGPGSPLALLAEIAQQEGDLATARRSLRQLLTHDHANVNAARRLASWSTGPDAVDDLEFALRMIADLDPFDADAHAQLGSRLLARGDHAAALVEFQATLALGPANLAEAHANLADVLLKLDRRDDAKRHALAALKQAPTFARAQDLLLAAIGR
jgi:tetratricopeptide (TPR) repeat protein